MTDLPPTPTRSQDDSQKGVVDFEEAIALTGYGRFNYILLVVIAVSMAAQSFVTSEMAYVLPAAECDLELTAMRKGAINAAMYAGMITSAFVWGALADYLGRRKLLLFAYLSNALLGVCASQVNVFWVLFVARFLSGAVIIGPVVLIMTYTAEMHGQQYRSKILMWTGMFQSIANAILAVMAMFLIPMELPWLESWRVFLLASCTPALLSGLLFIWLPESPKFLVYSGRQDDAMDVFRRIYALNTGNDAANFPVKIISTRQVSTHISPDPDALVQAATNDSNKSFRPFGALVTQFVILFRTPYIKPLMFGIGIQFLLLFVSNSVRMYIPQIYSQLQEVSSSNGTVEGSWGLCSVLQLTDEFHMNVGSGCIARPLGASVFFNSVVVALSQATGHLITGLIVHRTGDKAIVVVGLLLAAAVEIGYLWAADTITFMILASAFMIFNSNAYTAIIGIIVNIFPTSIRSSALSMTNLFGRLGSLAGNVIFPLLLSEACIAAFLVVAAATGSSAVISLFIPTAPQKVHKKTGKQNKMTDVQVVYTVDRSRRNGNNAQ